MNADSGAVNKKIEELGIQLQKPVKPVANYVTTVQTGNLVFTSGHGPIGDDGQLILGQLGTDMDIEGGYQAARAVGIGLLSTLKATLGNLDRIKKIVKLVGFVNSSADFKDQPAVVNGASDLFVEVFGDKGRHARSAVGMVQLPGGIAVEVEMIVEVE
ncbi:MAG: RidA family protein [Candidatus Poribacteria bacterium]|jgi:enamine deaminase RidA (YjgF/YER057c/UK114 family)|nr:RidA family protein [Candidatus Poribacteria bacterium]|tara:strand:+ start:741 stop:1214 length:474 start_codon:yes stop_codon:yes gene_type:complete